MLIRQFTADNSLHDQISLSIWNFKNTSQDATYVNQHFKIKIWQSSLRQEIIEQKKIRLAPIVIRPVQVTTSILRSLMAERNRDNYKMTMSPRLQSNLLQPMTHFLLNFSPLSLILTIALSDWRAIYLQEKY